MNISRMARSNQKSDYPIEFCMCFYVFYIKKNYVKMLCAWKVNSE